MFVHFRQAQSDVERAREDASIGSKHLEEQMVSFEKRRLHDIKVGIFLRHTGTLVSPFCQSKISILETPDLRYYIDIFLALPSFQTSMLDYFKIQLVFHAKAIEFYSKCFESMSMVDEERDLQVRLKSKVIK